MKNTTKNVLQPKFHVKAGDKVVVIAGDHKTAKGDDPKLVKKVIYEKQRAIVEGVNIVKKHKKPTAQNPQGGIVEEEAPIHISNIMVVDADGVATKTGRRKDENGFGVRYSKKSDKNL